MGDVRKQERTDFIGDGAELRIVNRTGVGARTHGDHFRLDPMRGFANLVVVEQACLAVHAIRCKIVELATKVDW